jgi:glucosyl-dolichyl phosphate glucuronosyltransferase
MSRAQHTVRVSIAICTYNRSQLLFETLESLCALTFPVEEWEVLVVDNNSSDNTAEVTRSFTDKLPRLRYIHEPQQGLAYARNTAITQSDSPIIVFADDDVLVEPDWLTQLVAPYEISDAIACVAGSVYPVFPEGLPQWMERDWARPLVLTDEVGPMPDSADPMGANLSFRRSVFETIGDFRVDLGRKGNSLLCGEDAEIVRRLRKAGFEAWFVPAAKLFHQFPRSRMNLKYAMRHGYDSARSKVNDVRATEGLSFSYRCFFMFSRLLANLLKLPLSLLAGLLVLPVSPAESRRFIVRSCRAAGYLKQILTF